MAERERNSKKNAPILVGYEPPEGFPHEARMYLVALSQVGTLTGACRDAGVGHDRPYGWRRGLEGFAEAEEAAREAHADWLEEQLFTRAPLDKNPLLLIFALKGARPQKYNERIVQEHVGRADQPIQLRVTGLSREEVRGLLEEARRGGSPAGEGDTPGDA